VKVILTQDVPKLGKSGEMKTVADGYATNFLIRQNLAVPAAGGAYRAWQHDIASREDKRKREREDADIAATRIASTTLTMGVKVGEGGKLFGSITAKDIADALGRRGTAQVARDLQGRDQGAERPRSGSDGRRRTQGLGTSARGARPAPRFPASTPGSVPDVLLVILTQGICAIQAVPDPIS
jgi:large subunit ribosomal protein L9